MKARRPVLAPHLYRVFRGDQRIADVLDVAVAVDTSEATAYRWTNGEADPSVTQIDSVCEAFPEAAKPLLTALVSRHGFRLVLVDGNAGDAEPRSLGRVALRLGSTLGEFQGLLADAQADGRLTHNEMRHLLDAIREVESQAAAVAASLHAAVERRTGNGDRSQAGE